MTWQRGYTNDDNAARGQRTVLGCLSTSAMQSWHREGLASGWHSGDSWMDVSL